MRARISLASKAIPGVVSISVFVGLENIPKSTSVEGGPRTANIAASHSLL